jgi:hypothetical protein
MKKHEITFLLGIAVGFLLARSVIVNNLHGNSNSTFNIRIGTKVFSNKNKG